MQGKILIICLLVSCVLLMFEQNSLIDMIMLGTPSNCMVQVTLDLKSKVKLSWI